VSGLLSTESTIALRERALSSTVRDRHLGGPGYRPQSATGFSASLGSGLPGAALRMVIWIVVSSPTGASDSLIASNTRSWVVRSSPSGWRSKGGFRFDSGRTQHGHVFCLPNSDLQECALALVRQRLRNSMAAVTCRLPSRSDGSSPIPMGERSRHSDNARGSRSVERSGNRPPTSGTRRDTRLRCLRRSSRIVSTPGPGRLGQ